MASPSRSTDRMVWLDALRLTAGISMVGLHSTADPTGEPWVNYAAQDRIAPMLMRAVIYIARTELFMVISIFLLLLALERRPRGYGTTIAEQARRLLPPFGFWTVYYLFFNKLKATAFGYPHDILAQVTSARAWADNLLLGGVKYHMHFIPTLFGLLLFYPLFRVAVRHPIAGFGVIACLLVKREIDLTLFPAFWGSPALPYLVRGVKILSYVGYGMAAGAFAGIWLRRENNQLGNWAGPLVHLGAMLFAIKLIATWRTVQSGSWQFDYTPGYWADFLMPIVLFATCMCLSHRRWPRLLSRIAPYSFGIYLCHPMFLDLAEIWLRDTALAPVWQVLFKIGFALGATSLLVAGLSRIPWLAWTIGLGPLPFARRAAPATPKMELS